MTGLRSAAPTAGEPAAEPGTPPALTVRDLGVAYGSARIVSGLSIDIGRRERLGVIGESGCGKTTLGLSLMRLLPDGGRITSGVVTVAGREVTAMSEKELRAARGRDMALIYQDASSSLDPVKRIGSQLAEAVSAPDGSGRPGRRRRKAEIASRVGAALDGVGIDPERASSYPYELSGGMRQRVAIAMALMNDPRLVIADEPTTALDVTTQASVLELLDRKVAERNCALLLITHDLGVVADRCDTTAVMYEGRIVEYGPTATVLGEPAHPYTRALVECARALERRDARRLPVLLPTGDRPRAGCAYAPRCPIRRDDPLCVTDEPAPASAGGAVRVACHHRGDKG